MKNKEQIKAERINDINVKEHRTKEKQENKERKAKREK